MFMAVYPYVWLSDVMVLSETLAMTANLAVALLCYRVLRDQSWGWIVALGVAAGLAALVRAEMVLLGPLLILPMLLRIKVLSFRQQAARIVVAAVAMVAVLTPWLYRNMTIYNHPVTMSTGTGITLANSNCDDTYDGGGLGFWSFQCIPPLPWTYPEDQLRATDAAQLRLWVDQSGIAAPSRRHARPAGRSAARPRPDGRPVRRRGLSARHRHRLREGPPRPPARRGRRPLRAHVGSVPAVAAADHRGRRGPTRGRRPGTGW